MGSIREVGIEWGRVGHGEVDRVVAMGWMDGPTMIKSNISRLLEVAAQWVQVRAQWVQVCVGIGTRLDRVGATQCVESRSENVLKSAFKISAHSAEPIPDASGIASVLFFIASTSAYLICLSSPCSTCFFNL